MSHLHHFGPNLGLGTWSLEQAEQKVPRRMDVGCPKKSKNCAHLSTDLYGIISIYKDPSFGWGICFRDPPQGVLTPSLRFLSRICFPVWIDQMHQLYANTNFLKSQLDIRTIVLLGWKPSPLFCLSCLDLASTSFRPPIPRNCHTPWMVITPSPTSWSKWVIIWLVLSSSLTD